MFFINLEGTEMDKTIVAQAIDEVTGQADQAGELFAKSEIDAGLALEMFARALGTEPSFEHWVNQRTKFINAYVRIKPQAKGNSADAAFLRFKNRLTDAYGISAPKSTSEAAQKKAAERADKAAKVEAKYANTSTAVLRDLLKQEYQAKADKPSKSSALLREYEGIVKARDKTENAMSREALKNARTNVIEMIRACEDLDKLEACATVLDPDNELIQE